MPEYRFHHIHLHSPDPLKTADFYLEALGGELVTKTEAGEANPRAEVKVGGTRVLIMKGTPAAEPVVGAALDHIGLRTMDMDASVTELKAHGAKFRDEPRDFMPGVRIAFFWAPDNVLVELVEIKTG
jgi:catechol 2,3-dioxygenase-like lactoylglutathione lyase family enzyme